MAVGGYLAGGMTAWSAAGLPESHTPQLTPAELHQRLATRRTLPRRRRAQRQRVARRPHRRCASHHGRFPRRASGRTQGRRLTDCGDLRCGPPIDGGGQRPGTCRRGPCVQRDGGHDRVATRGTPGRFVARRATRSFGPWLKALQLSRRTRVYLIVMVRVLAPPSTEKSVVMTMSDGCVKSVPAPSSAMRRPCRSI